MIHARTLTTLLLAAALVAASGCRSTPEAEKQPEPLRNVLFLFADDHSTRVMGAYGNSIVRTPNLDRLASQGVRFDSGYVNCPFCTPSRQSLITSKYPHASGVTLLSTPLADDQITIAEHLKQTGFKTAAVGKMHFNSDKTHGFDFRIDGKDHDEYLKQHPARRPPPDQPYKPVWAPFRVPAREWLNADRRPGTGYPRPADAENQGLYDEDFLGTYFVRQASDFMEKNRSERMCVWLSFYEPHSPYNFPIEFANNSDPAKMPLQPVSEEDDRWIPQIFRPLSEDDRRGIIASYYNSVEYLDTNIGRVLDHLERLGLADSTLVVYAGDHGYLLTDHGRFEKHMMWEEVVRTPMIIRDPRYPARAVSAMVEMIDLVPTILDALGEPPLPGAQGRSLMPLIRGTTNEHRDFVFSEYFHDNKAMVRTHDWKYIYTTGKSDLTLGYETGFGPSGRLSRLYDMSGDPRETTNVASDAANASVVQELQAKMLDVFLRTDPRAPQLPQGLSTEDALDWFLVPPEETKATP